MNKKFKILVVDDSRAMQAVIRRSLKNTLDFEFDVTTAEDGELALAAYEAVHPDLVITDWHMPHITGLELLQALRQRYGTSINIGFITTEKQEAMLAEAFKNGAQFVVSKPFNDTELNIEITKVFNAYKLRSQIPPEKEPQPAYDPPPLMQTHELNEVMAKHFDGIPYRLVETARLSPAALSKANLLALYKNNRGLVIFVVVLNGQGVNIIEAAARRLKPVEFKAFIAQDFSSKEGYDGALKFLNAIAARVNVGIEPAAAHISNPIMNIADKDFGKLTSILSGSKSRRDCKISVPGCGDGLISILEV